MNKKEAFIEALKQRHPGCDCATDDEVFGLVADEREAADKALADFRKRESQMADMFYADPRTATFLRSWREGADPVVELVRNFGSEIRQALDDPEMQEKLAEANREYLERVAREHQLTDEFEANIAQSVEMIDRVAARDGVSDELIGNAWEWLRQVTDQGIRGIVTEEALLMALHAICHERDVAAAAREGEVRGRNTAIDEHLRRRSEANDGTVARSGTARTRAGRKLPPLGVLDSYAAYRSVWE